VGQEAGKVSAAARGATAGLVALGAGTEAAAGTAAKAAARREVESGTAGTEAVGTNASGGSGAEGTGKEAAAAAAEGTGFWAAVWEGADWGWEAAGPESSVSTLGRPRTCTHLVPATELESTGHHRRRIRGNLEEGKVEADSAEAATLWWAGASQIPKVHRRASTPESRGRWHAVAESRKRNFRCPLQSNISPECRPAQLVG